MTILQINIVTDNCHGVVTPVQINHRFNSETEALEWVEQNHLVRAWWNMGRIQFVEDTGQTCTRDHADVIGLFE